MSISSLYSTETCNTSVDSSVEFSVEESSIADECSSSVISDTTNPSEFAFSIRTDVISPPVRRQNQAYWDRLSGKIRFKGIEKLAEGNKILVRYTNGNVYIGAVKDGERHGVGVYTYVNKNNTSEFPVGRYEYHGAWCNGKMHGNGILYWPDKRKTFIGKFVDGKRVQEFNDVVQECNDVRKTINDLKKKLRLPTPQNEVLTRTEAYPTFDGWTKVYVLVEIFGDSESTNTSVVLDSKRLELVSSRMRKCMKSEAGEVMVVVNSESLTKGDWNQNEGVVICCHDIHYNDEREVIENRFRNEQMIRISSAHNKGHLRFEGRSLNETARDSIQERPKNSIFLCPAHRDKIDKNVVADFQMCVTGTQRQGSTSNNETSYQTAERLLREEIGVFPNCVLEFKQKDGTFVPYGDINHDNHDKFHLHSIKTKEQDWKGGRFFWHNYHYFFHVGLRTK